MTIISLKKQLTQFLNTDFLNKTAKNTQFSKRIRSIKPFELVTSLVSSLSKGNCHSIADFHRQFNGMQLSSSNFVAYKPFHNQLRKPEFTSFMERLVEYAIAQLIQKQTESLPKKLNQFSEVILQDGSSFCVHKGLSDVFPSRFKKSPAAVECHMTMSLFEQAPKKMAITADTESERKYLPTPCSLNGKLLLADAGYVDLAYFNELDKNGAAFLVRGGKSLNPTIIEGRSDKGRLLPKLAGKKLKDITRRTNKSEVLDLTVHWKNLECRIIRRWFKEEKRFCIWLTNLTSDEFTADEVMSIYRCRWQIELLFKELKSDTNWTRFATEQKAIVEGLIWASLLTLIIRRSIALKSGPKVSVFKSAKNVDVWFLPIIKAIAHRAWKEIEHEIMWALEYLSQNALRTKQRKSKQDSSLDGIFSALNS